jgi:hypothetical protein
LLEQAKWKSLKFKVGIQFQKCVETGVHRFGLGSPASAHWLFLILFTQIVVYYKTQNYCSHILKRINIHAFKFVPVERLHLKMVMNQCLFEYSYGKPVGTAIKNYFFLGAFCFVLI